MHTTKERTTIAEEQRERVAEKESQRLVQGYGPGGRMRTKSTGCPRFTWIKTGLKGIEDKAQSSIMKVDTSLHSIIQLILGSAKFLTNTQACSGFASI